ncbi:MAG: hypothetical protein ACRC2T_13615, partial [Thermoguttaceae bacterium]
SIFNKMNSDSDNLQIIKAVYGSGETWADVTDKVSEIADGGTNLDIPNYNSVFGDPVGGVVKTLKITYKFKGGDEKTAEFKENAQIELQR